MEGVAIDESDNSRATSATTRRMARCRTRVTRTGSSSHHRPQVQLGYSGPKPGGGAVVQLEVTATGATNVPSNASAVVLNVTGTSANDAGYVTVWPCGAPRPNASNLNLVGGGTTPNLVITRVGVDGKVCMFTDRGTH